MADASPVTKRARTDAATPAPDVDAPPQLDLMAESPVDASALKPSGAGAPQLRLVTCPDSVSTAAQGEVLFKGVVELKASLAPDGFTAARDLAFVLDISGSMCDSLVELKRVVDWAVSAAGPTVRVCIIVFDDKCERLTNFVACTEQGKRALKGVVASLQSRGGTDIKLALREAKDALQKRAQCNPLTQVVLVSDGQDFSLKEAIRQGAAKEVTDVGAALFAVGLGAGHDAELLNSLTVAGSGTFAYAETADDVPMVVGSMVGGVASAVASGARLTLDLEDSPRAVNLVTETMAFILADQTLYFPFTVSLEPASGGALVARLSALDAGDGSPLEATAKREPTFVTVSDAGTDAGNVKDASSADALLVDSHLNRVAAANAMREATELAQSLQWAEALQKLNDAKVSIQNSVSANEALCQSVVASLEELVTKLTEQRDRADAGFYNQGTLGLGLAMVHSYMHQRSNGLESAASAAFSTRAERLASAAASQHLG